jgi:hypothetical protein
VLRQIEARYQDIAFDWAAIRESQQVIEPSLDIRRRRPKRDEGESPAAAPPPEPDPAAAPVPPRPPLPSAIEGATPDEQIAFLTRWYPVFRERIALKTADPARSDALVAVAERLNPAAWTDADQITTGLQQATDAMERLTRVLSRRRRRGRKRAQSGEAAGVEIASAEPPGVEGADGADSFDAPTDPAEPTSSEI